MQSNYFRVSILGQLSGNAQTLSVQPPPPALLREETFPDEGKQGEKA